ncbi:hypothetical protein U1Q18_026828 [Sarracenia purpurea var. burkii]
MAATYAQTSTQNSSQRGLAMALAIASAILLSPLYGKQKRESRSQTGWNSGFVLPVILAGLIIAIKTTSSSSSTPQRGVWDESTTVFPSSDPSSVLRIGRSSWGLAGVLVVLMLVLSWQDSVHNFFWR